jgi:hypothetical protein
MWRGETGKAFEALETARVESRSRPRFVVLGEGGGLLGAPKKPVRHVQEVGIVELRL